MRASGAYRGGQKVEIYIPASKKTCNLTNLPDSYRLGSSMCGGLLCGGGGVITSGDYCLEWDPETGNFSETPVGKSIGQQGFSCWNLQKSGVLIMGHNKGGDDRTIRTTELVVVNGTTSSSSFKLEHKIR